MCSAPSDCAGKKDVEDGAASQQVDSLLSNGGVQIQEDPKPDPTDSPNSPQEPTEQDAASLDSPLPEKLQNLKLSSNVQGSKTEEADCATDAEKSSAAGESKLQSLRGGLKGKSAVKEQKPRHQAKKGYLIKGCAATFRHFSCSRAAVVMKKICIVQLHYLSYTAYERRPFQDIMLTFIVIANQKVLVTCCWVNLIMKHLAGLIKSNSFVRELSS